MITIRRYGGSPLYVYQHQHYLSWETDKSSRFELFAPFVKILWCLKETEFAFCEAHGSVENNTYVGVRETTKPSFIISMTLLSSNLPYSRSNTLRFSKTRLKSRVKSPLFMELNQSLQRINTRRMILRKDVFTSHIDCVLWFLRVLGGKRNDVSTETSC